MIIENHAESVDRARSKFITGVSPEIKNEKGEMKMEKYTIVCSYKVRNQNLVSCTTGSFDSEEEALDFLDNYFSEIRKMVAEWECMEDDDLVFFADVVHVMDLF